MECKKIAVAIDGPAGAGKSSVAKAVAKKLKYIYVDTGAMYRAVGLYALTNSIDTCDKDGALTKALDNIDIKISTDGETQKIYLNDIDVSGKIRTSEVSRAASDVATVKNVRKKLVVMQQKIAQSENVVMDGRDIATAVLPDAEVKIFLTADAEKRARRRYDELLNKGENVKFDDILRDINNRDLNDSNRKESPLTVAKEAKIIDNGDMNLEQTIEYIYNFIQENIKSEE